MNAPKVPNDRDTSVLIVGGGPSGLTLACDLLRRGVRCLVVDKLAEPFRGSRGKGLQPRTLEVFDDLGVLEEVTRAGGPFPPFRGRRGAEVLWERTLDEMMGLAKLTPNAHAPYGMWMLPQSTTEAILRRRVEDLGGAIAFGAEVTAIAQDEGGVTATVAHAGGDEIVRASYLVGADGGRSFVRRALGVGFAGETGTYRSIIADVEIDGLERGYWHMWRPSEDPLDRVTLCALPNTDLFQFSAPLLTEDTPELRMETLQKIFAERAPGAIVGWRELRWITLYRLNQRLADRFRVGRVFLVGDAAHVHSPFGGQGVNTSIQDAYNLGWKLEAALRGAPARVLDSYEAERIPIAEDVLGLSSSLHRENYVHTPAEEGREGNKDIYQLALHYRDSRLSSDTRSAPGRVRAGDRAPDAPCRLMSGMPTRLFDLFRGPHWTVLALGDRAADFAARVCARARKNVRTYALVTKQCEDGAAIMDEDGAVRRGYSLAEGDVVLVVRPDGYLGLVADHDCAEQAIAYFEALE